MRKNNPNIPIVYSCSGCSSAAQMANHIALQLDKLGVAEMSCIAGVGGDVPHLLKIAKSDRPKVVLDGCPLACAKSCLARHDITPNIYHQLSEHGIKKIYHTDFDSHQADPIIMRIITEIEEVSVCNVDKK
jgi:uncharacterized metal-binding protein